MSSVGACPSHPQMCAPTLPPHPSRTLDSSLSSQHHSSTLAWKIPWTEAQLEKNDVVPTSSQDEALARYSVSREVPCSVLKCEYQFCTFKNPIFRTHFSLGNEITGLTALSPFGPRSQASLQKAQGPTVFVRPPREAGKAWGVLQAPRTKGIIP